MSKGKKKAVAPTPVKLKLRTAAEVMNRLRWDDGAASTGNSTIMIGYDDRVNGPMEKQLDDFVPISHGGDIPEHRIWYFRRQLAAVSDSEDGGSGDEDDQALDPSARLSNLEIDDLVLWDRLGRVDKLFNSSGDANKAVSMETIDHVRSAMQNMARLEAEKKERRLLREQEKRRKAQRRQARNEALALLGRDDASKSSPTKQEPAAAAQRYEWKQTQHYEFSFYTEAWVAATAQAPSSGKRDASSEEFQVVTWNVLFDLHNDRETNKSDDEVRQEIAALVDQHFAG